MKFFTGLLCLCFGLLFSTAEAQFGREILERTKQSAKQKLENKVNNKIDKGIDKAVDAPEKIGKKKGSKNQSEGSSSTSTSSGGNDMDAGSQAIGEIIIKTNIKCAAGKEWLEELIRGKNGVSSVSIDEKTGNVYLVLGGDFATKEDIETLIRSNGYEANGKKKTGGKSSCN